MSSNYSRVIGQVACGRCSSGVAALDWTTGTGRAGSMRRMMRNRGVVDYHRFDVRCRPPPTRLSHPSKADP
jgi:hypothetical protein